MFGLLIQYVKDEDDVLGDTMGCKYVYPFIDAKLCRVKEDRSSGAADIRATMSNWLSRDPFTSTMKGQQ
jgi:hypothetical protein